MSLILLGILNSQAAGAGGGSYELIESNILTSSASSVTFSSIPQDYKHLQIRSVTRCASTNRYLWMRFNGDSSANYTEHFLRGNGSTVASAGYTGETAIYAQYSPSSSDDAGIFAAGVTDILDYTNTSKNTTVRTLGGAHNNNSTTRQIIMHTGLWLSTSAISSITLTDASSFGFTAGSRFSLYGVK